MIPAIAQDADTNQVLMLAYMNAESFAETVATGNAVFLAAAATAFGARERKVATCRKSSKSSVYCDGDTILLRVRQKGVACHEGYASCFFRELKGTQLNVIADRIVDPPQVYE